MAKRLSLLPIIEMEFKMKTLTAEEKRQIRKEDRQVRIFGLTARRMPPTQKHRPAVWEMMLGTVYAMNDDGETKYFDYKWDDAVAFSGATQERDPRWAKKNKRVRYSRDGVNEPRYGQKVLWITD